MENVSPLNPTKLSAKSEKNGGKSLIIYADRKYVLVFFNSLLTLLLHTACITRMIAMIKNSRMVIIFLLQAKIKVRI